MGRGRIRISYFDVVGKALPPLPDHEVGRAIAKLSATYRAGRSDFDFSSEVGRAAYAWHHLPAHMSDLTRLLGDLPELLEGRRSLSVLALGAGPGSEVLALLELISQRKAKGELELLERVEVTRVDHFSAWDQSFARLLSAAREAVGARRCGLGTEWELEAPAQSLRCDLSRAPLSEQVLAAAQGVNLILAMNLVSEVAPRGTEELPAGLAANWEALLQAAPEADALVLDRAGAPGVHERVLEMAERAHALGRGVLGPKTREATCDSVLTKRVKALYRHVKLPTTKHEDRPVKNLKTVWLLC